MLLQHNKIAYKFHNIHIDINYFYIQYNFINF